MAKKTSYYKITAGFPGYVYGWEIKLSMSVATISFSLVSFSATSLDLGVLPDFCSWNLTSGSKDLANVEPKEHWYFHLDSIFAQIQHPAGKSSLWR